MAYRSEEEQLKRRVEDLEMELARARQRIAHLEGRGSKFSLVRVLLGADVEQGAERTLPGRLRRDSGRLVEEVMLERLGIRGHALHSGDRITWSGTRGNRVVELVVTEREGQIALAGHEKNSSLFGAAYGGFGGGLGGGASYLVITAAKALAMPLGLAFAIWIGLVLAIARLLVGFVARSRWRALDAAIEELSEKLAGSEYVRVRPLASAVEQPVYGLDADASALADEEAERAAHASRARRA
ncbi:MAG: hypothetical protein U0271_02475 [Polyangiaceae bacterium]